MDNYIVYFSRFNNDPSGNGGDKRTAQICDILNFTKHEFISMYNMSLPNGNWLEKALYNPSGIFQTKLAYLYKQYISYGNYLRWSERFRDFLFYTHAMSHLVIKRLGNNYPALLMIDDPVFLAPVVHYAKSNSISLIALCHNIETLSREQVEPIYQREMLKYELDLIAKCDLVVTISKEENLILNNLGMNPVYLPYFPVNQTLERFRSVNNNRKTGTKSDYLLLGTAHNLPTLEGMKRIISTIANQRNLHDDRLVIAGYGTKERLGHIDDPSIDLRGEVTDTELDALLASIKGCIVYQENGSGALTKIPELLIAGVPVIINSHAARSYHNLPGIFEFAALEQLGEQMNAAAKCSQFPQVLSPPDRSILQKRIADFIPARKL